MLLPDRWRIRLHTLSNPAMHANLLERTSPNRSPANSVKDIRMKGSGRENGGSENKFVQASVDFVSDRCTAFTRSAAHCACGASSWLVEWTEPGTRSAPWAEFFYLPSSFCPRSSHRVAIINWPGDPPQTDKIRLHRRDGAQEVAFPLENGRVRAWISKFNENHPLKTSPFSLCSPIPPLRSTFLPFS